RLRNITRLLYRPGLQVETLKPGKNEIQNSNGQTRKMEKRKGRAEDRWPRQPNARTPSHGITNCATGRRGKATQQDQDNYEPPIMKFCIEPRIRRAQRATHPAKRKETHHSHPRITSSR